MRLRGELAQGGFGVFARIALGAKRRVAQARTAVFKGWAITEATAAVVAARTAAAPITPVIAAGFEFVVTRARATGGVTPVARFTATATCRRLAAAIAGSVVAAHGDHRLAHGGSRGWRCRRFSRDFRCVANRRIVSLGIGLGRILHGIHRRRTL